jgi:carotenoid cleavage dioxygenase-like enzyme
VGAAEDDGYLMTYVHDENRNKSELVVYDARTMSAVPVARVELPVRVPYGFHGAHITEAQLQQQVTAL